jgi:hypothetical protein
VIVANCSMGARSHAHLRGGGVLGYKVSLYFRDRRWSLLPVYERPRQLKLLDIVYGFLGGAVHGSFVD